MNRTELCYLLGFGCGIFASLLVLLVRPGVFDAAPSLLLAASALFLFLLVDWPGGETDDQTTQD